MDDGFRLASDELASVLRLRRTVAGAPSAASPRQQRAKFSIALGSDSPYVFEKLERGLAQSVGGADWQRVPRTTEGSAVEGKCSPPTAVVDEYERIPWEWVLGPPHVVVSAYCRRRGLIRKAELAAHVNRRLARGGGSLRLSHCVPASVAIDLSVLSAGSGGGGGGLCVDPAASLALALADAEDEVESGGLASAPAGMRGGPGCYAEAAAEAEEAGPGPVTALGPRQQWWILKPSIANRAAELFMVSGMAGVREAVREWPQATQWVLQRYVERPLLLAGRKFHLRVYLLLVGALQAWVYSDALALIAISKWRGLQSAEAGGSCGDPANLHHVTNTCFNADLAGKHFDESKYVRLLRETPSLFDRSRPGTAAAAAVSAAGGGSAAVRLVWSRVRAALSAVLRSFRGEFRSFQPFSNGFELMGIDFVVDDRLRPWLLEFNAGPDLKQSGTRLGGVMQRMLAGVVETGLLRRQWGAEGSPPEPASGAHRAVAAAADARGPHAAASGEPGRWELLLDEDWGGASRGGVTMSFQG